MKIKVELEHTQNFRMIDGLVFFLWPSEYLGQRGKITQFITWDPMGKFPFGT